MLSAAILLSAGHAPALNPGPAAGGSVEAAEALIASVVDRYLGTSAYEIEFFQESYWALADSMQTTSGSLSVVPPGHIAVRYDDGGRVVADGESLWVYVRETNQFFSTGVDSSDVFFDPVRMLSAYVPDARTPFGGAELGPGGGPGPSVVILRPRPPAVEPVRIEVAIDATARTVEALTAHSSAGDWVRYTLRATRFDAAIPDSLFAPAPPPGAEIIRGTPYGS